MYLCSIFLDAKSHLPLVLVNKIFFWNTAMFIHLDVICACFHAKMAEVSSFDKDHMACIFYYLQKNFADPSPE